MSTQTWTPVRRPEDDELVGYLIPAHDPSGTASTVASEEVVPATVFGAPLSTPVPPETARALLLADGLAALAQVWLFTRADGEVVEVRILSAYADRVDIVETEYGFFGPDSARHTVPAADGARVLTRPGSPR